MAQERVQRRLAAILAADVVGFTRMMGRDEAGTLARLKALRVEVFEPTTRQYRGRIFKIAGDGALCEFPSAVDAVRAAIEVQHILDRRNAGEPEDQRIALRIGIALGDVITEGSDLYGHGVNLAARLETLAEPGGICVAANVAEHLQAAGGFSIEDIGEHQLKNIERPIRVFRIAALEARETAPVRPELALPDKPSIAVLPFQNMSGDPEQEYFADGIVEDIITALSRIHWLFVIARNSSFTYKGKSVDVKQVGRELGVRYVLEGSVRKATGRVRITAQLIDATTGAHVWADRIEGPLDDIFDLQDRVTTSVAGVIEPALRKAEIERVRRKPTGNLDAYDFYLRAVAQAYSVTREANHEALRLLRRAIEIDPQYAAPYGLAALCYTVQRAAGWVSPTDPAHAEGARMAQLAASLGQDDPETLAWAGFVLSQLNRNQQDGLALVERALAINPNSADAWMISGSIRANLGQSELAIAHLDKSIRLSPLDVWSWYRHLTAAHAHFSAGRYEDASSWADKALRERPSYGPVLRAKAAICGVTGNVEQGREWVKRLLAAAPYTTISSVEHLLQMRTEDFVARYLDGLRKVGLPE
jgi:adenylate cyclase